MLQCSSLVRNAVSFKTITFFMHNDVSVMDIYQLLITLLLFFHHSNFVYMNSDDKPCAVQHGTLLI